MLRQMITKLQLMFKNVRNMIPFTKRQASDDNCANTISIDSKTIKALKKSDNIKTVVMVDSWNVFTIMNEGLAKRLFAADKF